MKLYFGYALPAWFLMALFALGAVFFYWIAPDQRWMAWLFVSLIAAATVLFWKVE